MKKLFFLVGLISILGIGYWLLSPIFIDKEVNDALDPIVEKALNKALDSTGEGLKKAGEKLQETKVDELKAKLSDTVNQWKSKNDNAVATSTNLNQQIPDEKIMSMFMKVMKEYEEKDITMKETMPAESDKPKVLASGSFVNVAHEGTGNAKIISLGASPSGVGAILRLENLDVINGPDLRVLLSKSGSVESSSDLGDYIELAKLKGNKGNQNYDIPSSVLSDISAYKSVIIYCKPFQVVFNSAALQ